MTRARHYPNLARAMAEREIRLRTIAESIGITERALRNKLTGATDFTWKEVCTIQTRFFPDQTKEELFAARDSPDV